MSADTNAPPTTEPTAPRRYSALPIVFHWLIAVLVFVQLGLGWYLNEVLPDHSPAQDRMQSLHVEIGLTLLLFVLLRILARFVYPAPRLPAAMAGWERMLAHAAHFLLYALILIVPLSGWALLSARAEPISFWGIPWPHLPAFASLGGSNPRPLRTVMKSLHIFWLIWAVVIALALHIGGAIKHQFDGHPVLWRMLPFLRRPDRYPDVE